MSSYVDLVQENDKNEFFKARLSRQFSKNVGLTTSFNERVGIDSDNGAKDAEFTMQLYYKNFSRHQGKFMTEKNKNKIEMHFTKALENQKK